MPEDAAFLRIRVARAARRYPRIFVGIADGSLNLTTVKLLAPYLNPGNAVGLLAAAAHQSKSDIELLLAREFPREDLPTRIEPAKCQELVPDPVLDITTRSAQSIGTALPRSISGSDIAEAMPAAVPPSRVVPLAPERFGLQTTIDRETQDDLVRARELLGPGAQVPEALKRALRLLVVHLEKRKLAAVSMPRRAQRARPSSNRHIPAEVKRIVRARDQDRCTFIGDNGQRCEERSGLEFDHIVPIARGGGSNPENLRQRCRGHNQLEADRAFGSEFMNGKRRSAAGG